MCTGRRIRAPWTRPRYFHLICLILIVTFQTAELSASQYWPQAQWRSASPESQGMNSRILSGLFQAVRKKNYPLDGLLIVRHGYLVLEAYAHLQEPHFTHQIYSCTKSVASALIGIAIDKGYIDSVEQTLAELFPERFRGIEDSAKGRISLYHLLTMTTGLGCEDSVSYQFKGLKQMWRSDDWVKYMIDLPLMEPPGSRFEYCNGASALLTAIIQKSTGMTAFEFALRHLFNPLNITDVHWKIHNGITIGYSDLTMRPRDMARLGYLYLREGRWNNHEIISPEWVTDSTKRQIAADQTMGYGYQWWVFDPDRYAARGAHGQRIFVLKDLDMVVVFTGNLENARTQIPEEILQDFIIPAVRSDKPLPENPRLWERLKSMQLSGQAAD